MDAETERRLLGLIGLGARARNVVIGVDRVRDAARRGKLKLAIVAPDASHNSREKVLPLLTARRIRIIEGPGAASLGTAVGKVSAVAVGITDGPLAVGIRRLMDPGAASGRQHGSRGTR